MLSSLSLNNILNECGSIRDRIHKLDILDKRAKYPPAFKPADYFSDYFGVVLDNDVETAELKVRADQTKYFDSLPLHDSQHKVAQNSGWTTYRLRLAPSFDFRQELLSRGSAVEVLSPSWLREELIVEMRTALAQYGKDGL